MSLTTFRTARLAATRMLSDVKPSAHTRGFIANVGFLGAWNVGTYYLAPGDSPAVMLVSACAFAFETALYVANEPAVKPRTKERDLLAGLHKPRSTRGK